MDVLRELDLDVALDACATRSEGGVVGERFELLELVEVADPAVADFAGHQRRCSGLLTASQRRGVTPLVMLMNFRPQLVEVAEEVVLEQLGVELRRRR